MRAVITSLVLAASAATAVAEPAESPTDAATSPAAACVLGVSADGSRIVVPYVDEDGARGRPNLTVMVAARTGAIVKTLPVVDADNGEVRGGAAAADKVCRALKLTAIGHADPAPADLDNNKQSFAGLAVTLSPTGTLRVTPAGHAALTRTHHSWRTQPDAADEAASQRASDKGEIACFNAGKIGNVYFDARRKVAVVFVGFRGNDSCWEPSSDVAIFAW